MRPRNSEDILYDINYRIYLFNHMVDDYTPSMYYASTEYTPESLMRMRIDFDSLVNEHNITQDEKVKSYYMRIRERIEALRDMKKMHT